MHDLFSFYTQFKKLPNYLRKHSLPFFEHNMTSIFLFCIFSSLSNSPPPLHSLFNLFPFLPLLLKSFQKGIRGYETLSSPALFISELAPHPDGCPWGVRVGRGRAAPRRSSRTGSGRGRKPTIYLIVRHKKTFKPLRGAKPSEPLRTPPFFNKRKKRMKKYLKMWTNRV